MKMPDLNGKRVCILGYGREGQSTLSMLELLAPQADVTVADQNPVEAGGHTVISGPGYLEKLADFDVIIKTPGIPWEAPADVSPRVTNATQIFLDSLPQGMRVVGVTGTKGKSSTAALIHHILETGGRSAYLAGNIGEPMLNLLPQVKSGDILVLELSSYQLNDLTTSPEIAVLTSFFPDHTDYHGSVEAYFDAKSHITKYQTQSDVVFFNDQSEDCHRLAEFSAGHQIPFGPEDVPAALKEHLPSGMILSNVAAACLVAEYLKIPADEISRAIASAPGLAHRQQFIGRHAGIDWVDDSAATTPQSTESALMALGDKVDTLIVGGLNRNYDFTALAKQLSSSSVKNIVIFPETGDSIRSLVEAAHPNPTKLFFTTASMAEAVAWAAKRTAPGKTCLLSSGAPSYNLFKNFGERGDAFQKAVAALDPR